MTRTIVYHISPGNPAAHLYTVACLIEHPAPEGQRFSLPAWIPGSYTVRDYARQVLSVTAESEGRELAASKLDKATWQVEPVAGPLLVRAVIHAEDASVRGAFLDTRAGFFNGVALCFRVHGREHDRCVLHLDAPSSGAAASWRVATSLRRLTGAEHEFGAFVADGYEDLIDHPVLFGELTILRFGVNGIPHELAIEGRHEADQERLAADLARLCAWHQSFWGQPDDLDRYVFLLRLGRGMGGLEHRFSSALAAGRDSLPGPGRAEVTDAYRRFLGLVSHEYFHLWNVKRIRPAELVGADDSREAYTRQLWIFEGITSYYDDLALLRSGLITPASWLELLGQLLTRIQRSPGRRRQTLEEASFDAWIKFYRPDARSPNHTISYYAKGALVALALDLEIRLRSQGRRSLDDLMRALWTQFGAAGSPGLAEGSFERLAEDIAGTDLSEFFARALRTTQDLPVGILLARFGIRMQMRAAEGPADRGGKPSRHALADACWLGLTTTVVDGRVRIATVFSDGPAEQAGLCSGDEVVAVDGYRLLPDSQRSLFSGLRAGCSLALHVFRSDELLCLNVMPAPAPRDTCYLELDEAADEAVRQRRRAWLGC